MSNIVIIFPPGLGGNHVLNLFSTDKKFQMKDLAGHYESSTELNAHFNLKHNLDEVDFSSIKSKTENLLCGHLGELLEAEADSNFTNLQSKIYVLIDCPANNKLAINRFLGKNKLNNYFQFEQKKLYQRVNIEKITGHKDIMVLPSDFIFVNSPKFILQFAKHKLGLALQEQQCEKLHQHWYRKILEKWK